MSYCVNCGVELDDSAKFCPLCDTPVINPNIKNNEEAESPFPEFINIPKNVRRRYAAFISSMLILLPNIVCIITNLIMTPHTLWSVYVVCTSALVWFLAVYPFIMKKSKKYLVIITDTIASGLYIFLYYHFWSPDSDWFLKLAVPLDLGFFLIVSLLVAYFSKKRNLLDTIFAYLTAVIGLNVLICIVVNLYHTTPLVTYITAIIAITSLILLVFFAIADKNIRLRSWLSRKFFF